MCHGLGFGFLPGYLVETDDSIHWIELEDASFSMYVSIGTSKDRALSAATNKLATLARRHSIRQQETGNRKRSPSGGLERSPC